MLEHTFINSYLLEWIMKREVDPILRAVNVELSKVNRALSKVEEAINADHMSRIIELDDTYYDCLNERIKRASGD